MHCDRCKREVRETVHTLEGFTTDYYGTFVTRNDDSGQKARVEPESIVCKDCYEPRTD